jgi:fumarate hydratase class I
LAVVAEAEFRYSDLLPTGADDTPYRLITTEGDSTIEGGRTGAPSSRSRRRQSSGSPWGRCTTSRTTCGRRTCSSCGRSSTTPEASGNDRFVALDLLKNVNISAGGVLPMCQDTGTAIVMGKKSEGVLTGADDAEWISKGGQAALRGRPGRRTWVTGFPASRRTPPQMPHSSRS